MLGNQDVNLAAGGDEGAMRRILNDLIDHGNGLAEQLGFDPSAAPSATSDISIDAPSPPTIDVTAADGHVLVKLTNPATGFSNVAGTYRVEPAFGFQGVVFQGQQMQVQDSSTPDLTPVDDSSVARRIFHQLESSLTLNFDSDGKVTVYGPSTVLNYDITDPATTKYWRVKSKFENSDFCDYIYFQNPQTCGPVAIYSGVLRNSSLNLNSAATTPTGTNPCTQDGVTTNIKVAASTWKAGDQTLAYNSGAVDPGSFGTWLIYAKDPQRTGGTVVFLATAVSADITSDNANIYFGKITTAGGGGGTGGDAGGGTCCRAGVPYKRFDGTDQDCSTLRLGDDLRGVDGGPDIIQRITLHPARPCFRLEFDPQGRLIKKEYIGDFTVYEIELDRSHTYLAGANGIIDGAASTHTIQYAGGGFTSVFGAVRGETFNLIDGSCGSHNFQKS